MIAWACVLAAAVLVGAVVVLMLGWGGRLTFSQRLGLCAFTAGLVWAGPLRALGSRLGPGDLLMVTGASVYIVATHWRALFRTVERLDGAEDGRIDLTKIIR